VAASRRTALAFALLLWPATGAAGQAGALVSQALEVQGAVARIRGLPFVRRVPMEVKDRDAIRAYAVGRMDREYTAEELRGKSESLVAWGFVERPFDLRGLYEELLAEQIGGYYDPYEDTFFIADWLPPLLQKPIMAHELTHALQDQHFDLEPLLHGVEGNDDASLAGAAVVEGEGLAVMLDYALRPLGLSFETLPGLESVVDARVPADAAGFRVYATAPPIVKETLVFPYLQGLLFVREAKARGGWEGVSRLYEALPASTEQVLWPEKYFVERDEPTPVRLPDVARLLGPSWRRIDSNVLGELGHRVALRGPEGPESGDGPARGWDGDRYELYESGRGGTALVYLSVWDGEDDAEEFARAWETRLEADRPGTPRHVEREGARVVGLLNVARDRVGAVVKAVVAAAPAGPVP
jgi:hypothetical protein